MLEKLANFIQHHQLFNFSDQLAIAVSGGKDSVFAAHAFNTLEYQFVIVHCNFKLRRDESDEDALFVKNLADELEHCNGFYQRSFDTKLLASDLKLSTQETARKLRYDFFEELYDQKAFDYLITAHHADDALETFMINLQRESGIKGLKSIPLKRAFFRRPLLSMRSSEILLYLEENGIEFREDSSNKSDLYTRNLMRNKLIPQINALLPDFSARTIGSISNLRSEYELYKALIQRQSEQLTTLQGELFVVDIEAIATYPQAAVFLYNILESYHFNFDQCEQILTSSSSGKEFRSTTHQAIINRGKLEVKAISGAKSDQLVMINGAGQFTHGKYNIKLIEVDRKDVDFSKSGIEYIDADKLLLPAVLRNWEQGDKIQPYGMKGRKLISDLLIDAKLSRTEKDDLPLLANDDEILWVAGFRISDKLKLSDDTRRIYAISYFKS